MEMTESSTQCLSQLNNPESQEDVVQINNESEKNNKNNENGITTSVVMWDSPEHNESIHELSLQCCNKMEASPFKSEHEQTFASSEQSDENEDEDFLPREQDKCAIQRTQGDTPCELKSHAKPEIAAQE